MAHGVMMLAASVALRAAAPRRTPLTLRKASAADAIRDALSFAQRASPATADDRLAHSMRARDLTEDELRAVLVGRGVGAAATADVPRGILADLLGELRAADDARAAKAWVPRVRARSRAAFSGRAAADSRDVVAPDACARDWHPQLLGRRPRLKSGLAMSWPTRRAAKTSRLPRCGPTRRRPLDELRRKRPRASPRRDRAGGARGLDRREAKEAAQRLRRLRDRPRVDASGGRGLSRSDDGCGAGRGGMGRRGRCRAGPSSCREPLRL